MDDNDSTRRRPVIDLGRSEADDVPRDPHAASEPLQPPPESHRNRNLLLTALALAAIALVVTGVMQVRRSGQKSATQVVNSTAASIPDNPLGSTTPTPPPGVGDPIKTAAEKVAGIEPKPTPAPLLTQPVVPAPDATPPEPPASAEPPTPASASPTPASVTIEDDAEITALISRVDGLKKLIAKENAKKKVKAGLLRQVAELETELRTLRGQQPKVVRASDKTHTGKPQEVLGRQTIHFEVKR